MGTGLCESGQRGEEAQGHGQRRMRKAAPPEEEGPREAAAEGGAHRGLQERLQKF